MVVVLGLRVMVMHTVMVVLMAMVRSLLLLLLVWLRGPGSWDSKQLT